MTGPHHSPCPSCGALLASDQRYCLHCGARTAGPRVDPLRDMGVHAPPRPPAPVGDGGEGGRRPWWAARRERGRLAAGDAGRWLPWAARPWGGRLVAAGDAGRWLRRRPVGVVAGAAAVAAGVLLGWLSGPAPGVALTAAAPNRVVLLDQPVATATAVATPTAAPTPQPVDTPAATPEAPVTAAPTDAPAATATAAPTDAPPVAAVTATTTPAPAATPAIQHVWLVDVPDVNAGYPAELKASGTLLAGFAPVDPNPLAEDVALLSGQAPTPQTSAGCPQPTEITTVDPATGLASGDGCRYPAQVLALPGQLTQGGLTWQAYVADPAQGCPPVFVVFHSLDSACTPHALSALATDPASALDWLAVPDDATLRAVLPGVLASPAYRDGGLVVLAAPDGALALSPLAGQGVTVAAATGPYALLRTLEDAFGLLHLGHAGDADVAALGSEVFPTPTP